MKLPRVIYYRHGWFNDNQCHFNSRNFSPESDTDCNIIGYYHALLENCDPLNWTEKQIFWEHESHLKNNFIVNKS